MGIFGFLNKNKGLINRANDGDLQAQLELGKTNFDKGKRNIAKLEDALKWYEAALKQAPENKEAKNSLLQVLFYWGNECIKDGNSHKAKELFGKILSVDQNNSEAKKSLLSLLSNTLESLIKSGETDEAKQLIDEIFQIDPNHSEAKKAVISVNNVIEQVEEDIDYVSNLNEEINSPDSAISMFAKFYLRLYYSIGSKKKENGFEKRQYFIKVLERKVQEGDIDAMLLKAAHCIDGYSINEGLKWLRNALTKLDEDDAVNYANGLAEIANDSTTYLGENLDENSKKLLLKISFALLEALAEIGNVRALYNAACCWDSGEGTSKDAYKAFEYYKKAAENGHPAAMYNLAVCYNNGEGTSQNLSLARQWESRAREAGYEG